MPLHSPAPSTPDTAESVIRRMLQTASADVDATEAGALRGEPDGVHRHRTRVRRLRAVLASSRRVADPTGLDALRAALADWGRRLGAPRDAEVRADDAERALERLDVDDPYARRRLVDDERARAARLTAGLGDHLDDEEGVGRRQLQRECGIAVHVTAEGDAASTVNRMLKREARRVRRASGRADGSLDRYHALRKAGRRLRYVADAVDGAAPGLLGAAPERLAAAGKRLHAVLGDHRDLVLLADRADEAGRHAARIGVPSEVYARIADDARRRADECLRRLPKVLTRVRKASRALP